MIELMKSIIVWAIAIALTIFLWPIIVTILLLSIYAISFILISAWIVAAIKSGME
jgi:hypothetical protein